MIRAQLERILASAPFAASHRSQRFLRYVVENSLTDSVESLKEYAIAVEVFERDSSYDPAIDATVRVEAGRLRSRLRDYYAGEGRNDRLGIEIPKGGYRAFFRNECLRQSPPSPLRKFRSPRSGLLRRVPAGGAALGRLPGVSF
jgi:hypothetical protein